MHLRRKEPISFGWENSRQNECGAIYLSGKLLFAVDSSAHASVNRDKPQVRRIFSEKRNQL